MKRSAALTPLEQAVEDLTPNRVNYDIRVVWPTGEVSNYIAVDVPVTKAADILEVLADELRASEVPVDEAV